MKQSKTILFFGNERLATGVTTRTPILKALVSSGYSVAAIVTTPQVEKSSRKPRILEVDQFAREHNIPLIEFGKISSTLRQLKQLDAPAAVLASFGRIVPQALIDIFPRGIINVHPSLLPLHRGPIPIEAVILSGEEQTGVSLMQLTAEMDAGPLFDQQAFSLNGNENKQELSDRLGALGAQKLVELLPQILDGTLKPSTQTGSVTYDKRLAGAQGELDYNLPAMTLERKIRAFLGWPRSKTSIGSTRVTITSAHVLNDLTAARGKFIEKAGELVVGTAEGSLVIDRLIPDGSKEMSGPDFMRGHPLN